MILFVIHAREVKPKQPQDGSLKSTFEISLESFGIRGHLKQINK